MPRTAPATLPANTAITSTIWNDQVGSNLTHLLGLEAGGVPLTDLSAGSELLSSMKWVYTETRATNGDFATIPLSTLEGYATATGFVCEFGVRSSASVTLDLFYTYFNADTTASNYYSQRFGAIDGVASVIGESADSLAGGTTGSSSPTGSFTVGTITCKNFKNTNMWKNINVIADSMTDTATLRLDRTGIFWRSTNAVTSFTFDVNSGTPVTNSFIRVRFIF